MPNFTSQNILITAGAGGIGYAIAAAFGGAGAGVHVVDVDGAAVAAARAAHPAWLASVADVADEGAVAGVFAAHLQRFGGIDVLVNGAGIAGPTALLEEISAADWRRCLAVNLDAAFLCCRAAIPDMRRRGRGVIINISSTAGWHGYPLRAPYAASKWALLGLTKSIAMELGPAGIRVNAICPGSVDGERMGRVIAAEAARKGVDEAEIRRMYTMSASLRTFVNASDIADAALFLASPGAAKITGQTLNVDGNLESFGGVE